MMMVPFTFIRVIDVFTLSNLFLWNVNILKESGNWSIYDSDKGNRFIENISKLSISQNYDSEVNSNSNKAVLYIAGLGKCDSNDAQLLHSAVLQNLLEYDIMMQDDAEVVVKCVKENPLIDECSDLGLYGVLGRVALLHINSHAKIEKNVLEEIRMSVSVLIDDHIYAGKMSQPLLLSLKSSTFNGSCSKLMKQFQDATHTVQYLAEIICTEVEHNFLCLPICNISDCNDFEQSNDKPKPTLRTRIDGALIDGNWDTSEIIIFDNILGSDLRKELREVVLGIKTSRKNQWNDIALGPDPSRWERGGLDDVLLEDNEEESDGGACWGLRGEAVEDICLNKHVPIQKFECLLAKMFPDYNVCKLPEAVFGPAVSSITANAATSVDTFHWHIDADPALVPPSPWADCYGRYPNRTRGKPRFISCLLYINETWDVEAFGGGTKFLDPPTGKELTIDPIPGRILMMDQDITHTVIAPSNCAGKSPRYSLVWKLILHPKKPHQDMPLFSCDDSRISYFGSAKDYSNQKIIF